MLQEDEVSSSEDIEKIVMKLKEAHKILDDKYKLIQEIHDDFTKSSQEITIKRQALDAFGEAINLFRGQVETQEKFQKEAQPHEMKG